MRCRWKDWQRNTVEGNEVKKHEKMNMAVMNTGNSAGPMRLMQGRCRRRNRTGTRTRTQKGIVRNATKNTVRRDRHDHDTNEQLGDAIHI